MMSICKELQVGESFLVRWCELKDTSLKLKRFRDANPDKRIVICLRYDTKPSSVEVRRVS